MASFIYDSPLHQDVMEQVHGMEPPSPPARRNEYVRFMDCVPTTLSQVLRPPEDGFFLVAPTELRQSTPSGLFCPRPIRPVMDNPPCSGHVASGTNMTTDIAPDAAIISPVDSSFNRHPLEQSGERNDCIHSENLFMPVDITRETVMVGSGHDTKRHSYPPIPRLWIQPRMSRGSFEALLRHGVYD
jgi:hypothetical protein